MNLDKIKKITFIILVLIIFTVLYFNILHLLKVGNLKIE